MNDSSEAILALKPVTFHYKTDTANRREFGLIAEEVAEVDPGLVVRDTNGEITPFATTGERDVSQRVYQGT